MITPDPTPSKGATGAAMGWTRAGSIARGTHDRLEFVNGIAAVGRVGASPPRIRFLLSASLVPGRRLDGRHPIHGRTLRQEDPADREATDDDPSGPRASPFRNRLLRVEDSMRKTIWVWDLPFAPMTRSETVDAVSDLVESCQPSYFITANTHYAMLTKEHPGLQAVNARAAFLVADGAPLVWASRWKRTPLPERVAGSDLIFDLCARAAQRNYGVFLLGGTAGVAEKAARRLSRRYPALRIVGTESPPFRSLSAAEHAALQARIRVARPDILFVAFGQPKGEFWIADHHQALGVPVCVQVGASLDFVAGQVRRAPRQLQRLGLEWAYRMWLEPSRLGPRYARNARFLFGQVTRDLVQGAVVLRPPGRGSRSGPAPPRLTPPSPRGDPDSTGALTRPIGS